MKGKWKFLILLTFLTISIAIGYWSTDYSISGALIVGILFIPIAIFSLIAGAVIGGSIILVVLGFLVYLAQIVTEFFGFKINIPNTTGSVFLDKTIIFIFYTSIFILGVILMWKLGAWQGGTSYFGGECDKMGCY